MSSEGSSAAARVQAINTGRPDIARPSATANVLVGSQATSLTTQTVLATPLVSYTGVTTEENLSPLFSAISEVEASVAQSIKTASLRPQTPALDSGSAPIASAASASSRTTTSTYTAAAGGGEGPFTQSAASSSSAVTSLGGTPSTASGGSIGGYIWSGLGGGAPSTAASISDYAITSASASVSGETGSGSSGLTVCCLLAQALRSVAY